jgi:ribonuclease HI
VSARITVFADGACSGNPGPGGWGAIVRLPEGSVIELGGAEKRTTNNRMELGAVLGALAATAGRPEPVDLYTDSSYVIQGIKTWLSGWKRKGWLTASGEPVANKDLWLELEAAVAGRSVSWHYVKGHSGVPGNERCDKISVAFAKGKDVELFGGKAEDYGVDLSAIPADTSVPARGPRSGPSAPKGPAWYLSLLDGKLERHRTWPECEKRVKGKPARFKKVSSPAEEEQLLKSWGLS